MKHYIFYPNQAWVDISVSKKEGFCLNVYAFAQLSCPCKALKVSVRKQFEAVYM